jgi:oxygen-independent coproporphyrinogen-3 oxidase
MTQPQRHRLLHGYPQAAALYPEREVDPDLELRFGSDTGRSLLVGILPHPFCNPAVTGCGFCTFPHEPGNGARSAPVARMVAREIQQRVTVDPELGEAPVTAVYFGGGTANLTPAVPFGDLCKTLAAEFDCSAAEVTLEGVPAHFLRGPLLVDVLQSCLPARHHRISMGIQTFSEEWLRRMGRLAFGTPDTFGKVVELGHARGLTVSADLLFDLPHQTLDEMRQDVRRAIDLGLDHLGLYHLVLFAKLGTEWSHDKDLLAGLPSNERAADNWLDLRDLLLSAGFVQTTLTNFERREFQGRPDRFLYEECTFQPDRFDVLGFGPSAICYTADRTFQQGLKTLNRPGSDDYTAAVGKGSRVWDHYFFYGPRDQRILYLTRRLAALEVRRDRYHELFATDPVDDFGAELAALTDAGLLEVDDRTIRPTPLGMFYADSIAALWAWKQVGVNRREHLSGGKRTLPGDLTLDRFAHLNDSKAHHMG